VTLVVLENSEQTVVELRQADVMHVHRATLASTTKDVTRVHRGHVYNVKPVSLINTCLLAAVALTNVGVYHREYVMTVPRAHPANSLTVVGGIRQDLAKSVRWAHTKKAKDRRPVLTVNVARERISSNRKTQAQRAVVAWNALGVRPARTVRIVVA
jgi:hypothetical protein